jgi:FdhD protein
VAESRVPKLLLSQSARPASFGIQAMNETGHLIDTRIAGEHPLSVYLDKRELITLMTLGSAPECLVLGYLLNQGFISQPSELAQIHVDWDTEAAAVTSQQLSASGQSIWDEALGQAIVEKMAHKTVTTGCGQGSVYGSQMDQLAQIHLPARTLAVSVLQHLLAQVRAHESIYKEAGAVHGCALANAQGHILCFIEDVGRHNAADAIRGWMALNPALANQQESLMFYTTGRLTSEMVIKCAQMGIGILLSRSGLTQMGYSLARKLNMLMLGRCQGKHFLAYHGHERVLLND